MIDNENDRDKFPGLASLLIMQAEPSRTEMVFNRARAEARFRSKLTRTVKIVAIVAIAIGLISLFIRSKPEEASAAEQLLAATRASLAFQGWIETRYTTTLPGGQKLMGVVRINNQTGMSETETTDGGVLKVWMVDPAQNVQYEYDGSSNTLKIKQLSDDSSATIRRSNQAWGQEFSLQRYYSYPASPIDQVTKSNDSGLFRYDVQLRGLHLTQMPQGGSIVALSVWVDPQTKLAQRALYSMGSEGKTLVDYRYGISFHDIYDGKVPRAARIVDLRPTNSFTAQIAKLNQQSSTAFGDFIAIRTETFMRVGAAKTAHLMNNLYLYGRSGGAYCMFKVQLDGEANIQQWPTPSLDSALAIMKTTEPQTYVVSDGRQFWASDLAYNSMNATGLPNHLFKDQGETALKAKYSLPGVLWNLQIDSRLAAERPTTIGQADRPGQLGFQIVESQEYQIKHRRGSGKLTCIYWFDANRSMAPVQYDATTEAPANLPELKTLARHEVTDYSQFIQAQDGTWYPSKWNCTVSTPNVPKMMVSENHLQVWSGKKLDASWFTDPATWQNQPQN